MSAGEATRQRHLERMQATAIGAKVARRARVWTITDRRPFDTAVSLTLRSGRRTFSVSLPVCISGPCWADVGLRPVHAAPTQAALFRMTSETT